MKGGDGVFQLRISEQEHFQKSWDQLGSLEKATVLTTLEQIAKNGLEGVTAIEVLDGYVETHIYTLNPSKLFLLLSSSTKGRAIVFFGCCRFSYGHYSCSQIVFREACEFYGLINPSRDRIGREL